jgi:hypothetical protein
MNSYIGNKPLLGTTAWRRCVIAPSANPGYVTITLVDGPQAGRSLSVAPDGTEVDGPHDADGPWEQARLFGQRVVYDYEGLTAPVVYDAMV